MGTDIRVSIHGTMQCYFYVFIFSFRSSNKMPLAVREALAFAVTSEGKYTEAQAKKYIQTMETEGRLIEECWD